MQVRHETTRAVLRLTTQFKAASVSHTGDRLVLVGATTITVEMLGRLKLAASAFDPRDKRSLRQARHAL